MRFTAGESEFIPHPWFQSPHWMTMAPAFWPRFHLLGFGRAAEGRLFKVDVDSQILAHCNWQKDDPKSHPTLIIVHGLEGSSQSGYALGLAYKAFALGMNTVRLNLRNCGGTMHLTPTLYNAGMSADLIAVLNQLRQEGFSDLHVAGYSLGGNIVLKAAGELGKEGSSLLGSVAAISPSLDLAECVRAILEPQNRFYDQWFLRTLKAKIRDKAKLFPDSYDVSLLKNIQTLREFDDAYTAPIAGYGTAANYYHLCSALRVVESISVPTLIIAAEDDPLVPIRTFESPELKNGNIRVCAKKHGGHAAFIQQSPEQHLFDHFWAENRAVAFCQEVMGEGGNLRYI